jgi:hypothetical protein
MCACHSNHSQFDGEHAVVPLWLVLLVATTGAIIVLVL